MTMHVECMYNFNAVVHVGPPELLFEQNQIITVNVSEEVILNCTVSVSPDPVYSWSFPESCSSCPNTSNDSALIFTAEITNSGDYICVVENRHGNLSLSFMVIAVCKLIDTF